MEADEVQGPTATGKGVHSKVLERDFSLHSGNSPYPATASQKELGLESLGAGLMDRTGGDLVRSVSGAHAQ